MIQVTYTSSAEGSLGSDEIFKIIEKSVKNNMRDDLTGFLIFSGGRFFQLIEGPGEAIDALLTKLERDPRHRDLTVLDRSDIVVRDCPKWKMKRLMPQVGSPNFPPDIDEFGNISKEARIAVAEFLTLRPVP